MGDVGKLERVLLPFDMRKRGLSLFEKLRESGARRKKRQRAQGFSRRLGPAFVKRLGELAGQSIGFGFESRRQLAKTAPSSDGGCRFPGGRRTPRFREN